MADGAFVGRGGGFRAGRPVLGTRWVHHNPVAVPGAPGRLTGPPDLLSRANAAFAVLVAGDVENPIVQDMREAVPSYVQTGGSLPRSPEHLQDAQTPGTDIAVCSYRVAAIEARTRPGTKGNSAR